MLLFFPQVFSYGISIRDHRFYNRLHGRIAQHAPPSYCEWRGRHEAGGRGGVPLCQPRRPVQVPLGHCQAQLCHPFFMLQDPDLPHGHERALHPQFFIMAPLLCPRCVRTVATYLVDVHFFDFLM
jgi:hypothetical protein